MRLAANCQTW